MAPPASAPLASVVIPAHNEAAVIARCLARLLDGAAPGELDVVVVCNGCTDATARQAARFAPAVRVVTLARASKVAALTAGERLSVGYPRIYLDADVELGIAAVRALAAALAEGTCLAAAPRLQVSLAGRSRCVRAYYSVWTRLPFLAEGYIGSGVVALSREGRERFTTLPEVIAEDLYLRTRFSPGERRVVEQCAFLVHPPRTVTGLVRRGVRVRAGNAQLARLQPPPWAVGPAGHLAAIRARLAEPGGAGAVAVYLAVHAAVRLGAWVKARRGRLGVWDRDETSRALT